MVLSFLSYPSEGFSQPDVILHNQKKVTEKKEQARTTVFPNLTEKEMDFGAYKVIGGSVRYHHVVTACRHLGVEHLLQTNFPTVPHMEYIRWVDVQKSLDEALQKMPEEATCFERNALLGSVSAKDFFQALIPVAQKKRSLSNSPSTTTIKKEGQVSVETVIKVVSSREFGFPTIDLNLHITTPLPSDHPIATQTTQVYSEGNVKILIVPLKSHTSKK